MKDKAAAAEQLWHKRIKELLDQVGVGLNISADRMGIMTLLQNLDLSVLRCCQCRLDKPTHLSCGTKGHSE